MNYPLDCERPADRTEFLYRCQEILRQLHNQFVQWRDVGFSRVEYGMMPDYIQAKYPYKVRLNSDEFLRFLNEDFHPKSDDIITEIVIQRNKHRQSRKWNVNIGDLTGRPKLSPFTRILNWIFG
jgi:hypothetical protein